MKNAIQIHLARLGRFALISGLTFSPAIAAAHDGAHVSRIVSDVESIAVAGSRMTLSLAVSNYSDQEVVLHAVTAQKAEVTDIAPVMIAPGAQQDIEVTLYFHAPIPGIFTAVLDFGADGQGPVLVMN